MNKKKAAKKKPGPKPKQKHLNGSVIEPFEIVTNPPVLSGWATPEIQAIRDKVDATIKLIQPGQGFIIDYKHKG